MRLPLVIVVTGDIAEQLRELRAAAEHEQKKRLSWGWVLASLIVQLWTRMSSREKEKAMKRDAIRKAGFGIGNRK